jgi:aspartate racemase
MKKIVGILGGMGPEATVLAFQKILEHTPAARDQEHLRIIIDNNPKIPERLPAIMGTGTDPIPMMLLSAEALARAGADFIIIPCVTAHYFLRELRQKAALPILSMLDEAASVIRSSQPGIRKIGLLAAEGTMQAGIFKERFDQDGVQTIIPEGEDRLEAQELIFKIKDTRTKHNRMEIASRFAEIGKILIRRGAEAILVGCTEISVAVDPGSFAVRGYDALDILAKAAIREAGLEPV